MALAFLATGAFAQSSGNFTAGVLGTACSAATLETGTGGTGVNGVPGVIGPVKIKVSSGSGVVLLITPSLVTGLFSSNTVNKNTTTSTTNVGIAVWIEVRDSSGNLVATVAPGNSSTDPVIFDQRIISISSTALASLLACQTTTTSCFTFTETTLSAHSFNFLLGGLATGSYNITLHWVATTGGSSTSSGNSTASCVGPGTLTVEQVKDFSFNTQLSF